MAGTKLPVGAVWAESGDKTAPSAGEIQSGWPNSATSPSRQRMNWIKNLIHSGLRYVTRRGVSDWDAAETYAIGDKVQSAGAVYTCIAATTNDAPASSPAKWAEWGLLRSVFDAVVARVAALESPPYLIINAVGYTNGTNVTMFVGQSSSGTIPFNSTTGVLTVPSDGIYTISGTVALSASPADAAKMFLNIGGVNETEPFVEAPAISGTSTYTTRASFCVRRWLAANTAVQFRATAPTLASISGSLPLVVTLG